MAGGKKDLKKYDGAAPQEAFSPLEILKIMMLSREADERESILFRQGRGQFCLPSAGHEALAAIAPYIQKEDSIYCYYRDRALLLALGMPLYDMALGFFAKEESSSAGRQMSSHFSYKPLNVMSCATPTGLQCLPAAGTAWGFKKSGAKNMVLCCIGDASTRQGEFFESLAFSIQEKLPIVFVVEDNGYGISTPTVKLTPLVLGMLSDRFIRVIDGRNVDAISDSFRDIISNVRNGGGPMIAWVKLDRLMSHTSSDDQARYRPKGEILAMADNDPIKIFKNKIVKQKILPEEEFNALDLEMKKEVKDTYNKAEQAKDPDAQDCQKHIFSEKPTPGRGSLPDEDTGDNQWTMSKAFNYTLAKILSENSRAIIFGEDVEDPKGGVFGLTKGLSSKYQGQVVNAPLAEATIAGLSSGLSSAGYLPIFELQFIDFIGPAFNQIVNQIATLRWRSAGAHKCPLIIYAPCGSYISGGGPWHSQTNESWLAHAPGLKIYMPSNANDAANMLYAAAHGDDPVLILLPKNQYQKSVFYEKEADLYPEKAKIKKEGGHVTIVAWGNCVEIALEAAARQEVSAISVEIIDLRSIVPCDFFTIKKSVEKTGRLIIVQEDNKTCSFGQNIISEIISDEEIFGGMYHAPQLVTRDDVHVPFNANLEKHVLPDAGDIVLAIFDVMGFKK